MKCTPDRSQLHSDIYHVLWHVSCILALSSAIKRMFSPPNTDVVSLRRRTTNENFPFNYYLHTLSLAISHSVLSTSKNCVRVATFARGEKYHCVRKQKIIWKYFCEFWIRTIILPPTASLNHLRIERVFFCHQRERRKYTW